MLTVLVPTRAENTERDQFRAPDRGTCRRLPGIPGTYNLGMKCFLVFAAILAFVSWSCGQSASQGSTSGSAVASPSTESADTSASTGTLEASHYSSLSEAVGALSPGATLHLASNYSATLASGVTIATAGVTIKCDPGAAIIKGGNLDVLTVTSANVTIDGCGIKGNGASTDAVLSLAISGGTATVAFKASLPSNYVIGSVISFSNTGIAGIDGGSFALLSASGSTVTFSTKATGSSSAGYAIGGYGGNGVTVRSTGNVELTHLTITGTRGHGIYLSRVTDAKIYHNTITGMSAGDGIYGDNQTSDIIVSNNRIDRTAATTWGHAIAFHSNTAGETVSQITVTNNNIQNGYSFCFEIGEFGGYLPTGLVLSGNNCNQRAWPTWVTQQAGGWSLSGVDGGTLMNNVYTNFTGRRAYACIEAVTGTRLIASGNICYGGTVGLIKQSYTTLTGNYVIALYPKASGGNSGVFIGGSNLGINSNYNTVSGNTIDLYGLNGTTAWAANSYFASGLIILDNNSNLQRLSNLHGQDGCKTGETSPAWSSTLSAYTTDNQCVWQMLGPGPSAAGAVWTAIRLQCNKPGTDCSHNSITNNILFGYNRTPGDVAVSLEAVDGSTASNITVSGNDLIGWATCYSVNRIVGSGASIWNNSEDCSKVGTLNGANHSSLAQFNAVMGKAK